MKLFVLGATGKTGTWVLELAPAAGHEVTAFVRSPEKITRRDPRLTVRGGDPTNAAQLTEALAGHDAVISVIGARGLGPTTIHADCARATVRAMKATGIRRLVALTSAFCFPDMPLVGRVVRRLLFGNIVRDHLEMERIIVDSGLDYTLVRPPRLLGGEPRGCYQVKDGQIAPKNTIRFADVAHFMVREAEKNEHVRKAVGLSDA